MKKLLFLVVIVALGAGGWWYREKHVKAAAELHLRTGKVQAQEVIEGVAASGAVQPLLLVQVGTNVSGTVDHIYKDWNDHVKAGECIAMIDSRRYLAQVAQDLASIGQARASYNQTKAKLIQAQHDLTRNRTLAEKRLVAESDLDNYIANEASLTAQLELTAAVVSQDLAQLQGDQLNVEYARIVSPVDGVVVARQVDVGQTVAASFSTPTLYQIANDLKKIQVQASVPEADVGKIKVGQHAPFKVDAYPDNTFDGIVSQIRLASTTVQNVVTYTIMIDADNPKELLMPGMTANAIFEVARSEREALTVPVAALRFKPSDEIVDGPDRSATDASPAGTEKPAGDTPRGARGDRSGDNVGNGEHGKSGDHGGGDRPGGEHKGSGRRRGANVAKVYVRSSPTKVKAVRVRLGISDGLRTVVIPVEADELADGTEIVLGILAEEEENATNPFAPKLPGGGRR